MGKYGNPLHAPKRREFARQNVARLIRNEIVDMPTALKTAKNIPLNTFTPFWQITYEALDLVRSDGSAVSGDTFFPLQFGTALQDKNGEDLDETQRPHVCAQAFAGLGIMVFPGEDEEAYTGEEIGEVFLIEQTKFPTGGDVPLPIERLGKDFVFEGDVRTLLTKEEREAQGSTPNAAPSSTAGAVELTQDGTAMALVTAALEGVDGTDRSAVINALREVGQGKTLNGQPLLGLAVSGKVIPALQEAGAL